MDKTRTAFPIVAILLLGCSRATTDQSPIVPEETLSARPRPGGAGGSVPPDPEAPAPEPARAVDIEAAVAIDGGATPPLAARDAGTRPFDTSAMAAPLAIGGPAPPCRFRFCDSFETVAAGGAPNPAVWRKSGNMTVVAGRAARGTNALEIKAPATPSETFITSAQPLPVGTRAFWGRLFFNLVDRPADFFHFTMVEVKTADQRGPGLRYGGISTGTCAPKTFCYNTFMFQLKPAVYGGDEGAVLGDDLKQVISDKTWHCLEWSFDADKREARMFYDGQERPKVHYTNGKPEYAFPDPLRLSIGWGQYQTGKSGVGWTVLVDEVAISDQRVGCDPN